MILQITDEFRESNMNLQKCYGNTHTHEISITFDFCKNETQFREFEQKIVSEFQTSNEQAHLTKAKNFESNNYYRKEEITRNQTNKNIIYNLINNRNKQ